MNRTRTSLVASALLLAGAVGIKLQAKTNTMVSMNNDNAFPKFTAEDQVKIDCHMNDDRNIDLFVDYTKPKAYSRILSKKERGI